MPTPLELAPYDVAGPLPPDSVLRRHPRLLATPHLGYVTEAGYRQFYGDVVEDITAFLEGSAGPGAVGVRAPGQENAGTTSLMNSSRDLRFSACGRLLSHQKLNSSTPRPS